MEVKVLGAQDVLSALKGLSESTHRSHLRQALYRGAVVVRDEARRRAPVRTGALKKRIIARTDKDPDRPGQYAGYVTIAKGSLVMSGGRLLSAARAAGRGITGPKIDPRRYAHLVEYGTRPHAVGKGSLLARAGGSRRKGENQAGRIHPGAAAKPFLRPALHVKGAEALEAVRRSLVAGMVSWWATRTGRAAA